jgi:hypothetical protein
MQQVGIPANQTQEYRREESAFAYYVGPRYPRLGDPEPGEMWHYRTALKGVKTIIWLRLEDFTAGAFGDAPGHYFYAADVTSGIIARFSFGQDLCVIGRATPVQSVL